MKKLSQTTMTILDEVQAIQAELRARNPDTSQEAVAILTQTAITMVYEMGEEVFAE